MRVSYVLRLNSEDLAAGHLVGEVEDVATGHIGALRGIEDLVSFCIGHSAIEPARLSTEEVVRGDGKTNT